MAIRRYPMSTEKKGKKRITKTIVNDTNEVGVHVETMVETLNDKGGVVGEPKVDDVYYPDRQLNKACVHDGKRAYLLTGG